MWLSTLKTWFRDSETILFARVQMFVGAALTVFSSMNLTGFLDGSVSKKQQITLFSILFTQGLITEIARRLRENQPPSA